MTAAEVIEQFKVTAGRYDLSSDRLYFYANAAQKWLDRAVGYPKEKALLVKTLAANETLIEFSHPRYIVGVYTDYEDEDNKQELDWKPALFDIDTSPSTHWPLKGIEVVATEEERTIYIVAVWHSPTLTAETISFWTLNPEMLVRSMQRLCEIDIGNTTRKNDFEVPLKEDCIQIYYDMVAEEMSGPTEYWRMD